MFFKPACGGQQDERIMMELHYKKMTITELGIVLDIYEDLAKEHDWPWDSKATKIFLEELRKKERKALPYYIPEAVGKLGKDHPKFSMISKFFISSTGGAQGQADCHNRSDWWTAIVHMLDDSKLYLCESDRKELYLDLSDLINHRLSRKEY